MKQMSGHDALAFLGGIEKAMDEAGGGQFRAFKLLPELDRIGLGIIAVELPPEPAASARPSAATDEAG